MQHREILKMNQIGVSDLKIYNTRELRDLKEPMEVTHHGTPIAVLVPYKVYQEWQAEFEGLKKLVAQETS
jgi:prevent-host-death family protein